MNSIPSGQPVWSDAVQKLYRQRWRICLVAALAHTMGMFHRAVIAPIADRVMADFGVTAVALGGLGAAYFYIYAAMQLPSGTLADTVGPRKTITAGLLLSATGSIVMGMAPSFGLVYLGRIIVSFGVSVAWLSVVRLVIDWFRPQESGTMIGLTGAISNLGQLMASTPLALLVIWIGWRMSLVTIGLVSLLLAAVNWFSVRDSPVKVGLPFIAELDGGTVPKVDTSADAVSLSLTQRFRIAFGDKCVWTLFLMAFGTYGAFSTLFQNWVVVYIMQVYSVTRAFAANFSLVAAIAMVVTFILSGFISDRLRRRRLPLAVITGTLFVFLLLWTFWNGGKPPLGALYPLSFLIGLSSGVVPVMMATVRDLAHPSVRGIASGLVNTGLFLGAAVAQPLFGYILDLGWRGEMATGARLYPLSAFQQAFFLCCFMAALSFIGALLVTETHCREVYRAQKSL